MKKVLVLFLSVALMLGCFAGCGSDNKEKKEEKPKTEVTKTETKKKEKRKSDKITMPKSAADYIGAEWTVETLTEHFKELGFKNIRTVPCDPDEDNYRKNIFEIYIETGVFSTDPWEAADEFKSDAEISIYYNEFPCLTVDNCPDLKTVLTTKDMDYMAFCNKYDGRYVEFDAYVVSHMTYMGDTSHIIDVSGGDYDGNEEISAFDESTYNGLIIRIGDKTLFPSIDKSVEVGDNVIVSGKIDASDADYYDCIYVETRNLSKR